MSNCFRVAAPFSDHMVLQRDAAVRIWGEGPAEGQQVTVTIGDYAVSCTVDDKGEWLAVLPPMPVNVKPQVLIIAAGAAAVTIQDVLVGDVWLVGGQSNAEYYFTANPQIKALYAQDTENAREEDNIRILVQRRPDYLACPESMLTPQKAFVNPERSQWRRAAGKARLIDMSVIGYFFAKTIADALDAAVPLGMVTVCAGAAALSELMPQAMATALGFVERQHEDTPPAGFYNGMMAPVQKMSIKGMIFYQGESDQYRPAQYPYLLNWYVEEMRRQFGCRFPFYYVQLSSHPIWDQLNDLRESQVRALDLLDNAVMVVARDVGWRAGDVDMPHPNNKRPVGERLAAVALARDYRVKNLDQVCSPIPKRARFAADSVMIEFNLVADGLRLLAGDVPTGFEIRGDGDYQPAQAEIISKNSVRVTGLQNPTAVRFAHLNLAYIEAANLGNTAGLPAAAFEIAQ